MKHSTFRPQLEELEPLVLLSTAALPTAPVPAPKANAILPSAVVDATAPVSTGTGRVITIDWGHLANPDPSAIAAVEQQTADLISRTDQQAAQIGLLPGSDYVPPPEQLAPTLAQGQVTPAALRQALNSLVGSLTAQKARLFRRTAAAAAAERQILADPRATFADELAARITAREMELAWRQASSDLLDVQQMLQAPDDQLVQKTLDLIAAWGNREKRLEKAAKAAEATADQLRQQSGQLAAQTQAAVKARGWSAMYAQQQRDLQALIRALPNP